MTNNDDDDDNNSSYENILTSADPFLNYSNVSKCVCYQLNICVQYLHEICVSTLIVKHISRAIHYLRHVIKINWFNKIKSTINLSLDVQTCLVLVFVLAIVSCVDFCMGHFVMVTFNLTYLHCLQHSFLSPADEIGRGILKWRCPSVRPSFRPSVTCVFSVTSQ